MLNRTVGGPPELHPRWPQLLTLSNAEPKRKMVVRGVWWLDEPKAERTCAPSDGRSWTCPRCRSHRCVRTNPGDPREAIYCCAVCGYTFHATARLPRSSG